MGLVAIFGAGVMGETLLAGLIRAGRPAGELVVTERRADRAEELRQRHGVDGRLQRRTPPSAPTRSSSS